MVRARVAFWTGVEIKVKFTFKDSSSVESTLNRPPPLRLGYESLMSWEGQGTMIMG